ncbi:MAG: DNA repair protein RecO [Myxococcales bacterium]|nr:DNA repair protein RecO [Myxococcales bacterium]USN51180.1 MAG: DNA repair protein RecO [Myxococcales bacterium]
MTRSRSVFARPAVHGDAFVTSSVRYGEKDCIVRLLLRDKGRRVAFFKNGLAARKGASTLQAPSLAKVAYVEMSDNKMPRLISFDIEPGSYALSLRAFAYASYIAELIEVMVPEEEECEPIYLLAEKAVYLLSSMGAHSFILRAFELNMLEFCGYLPDFDEIESGYNGNIFYDPIACRLIKEPVGQSFPITNSSLKLAKTLLGGIPENAVSENFDDLMSLGRIFHSRLRVLGIKELKSVSFLKQLSGKMAVGSGQT